MIAWGADGKLVTAPDPRLRLIDLGGYKLYVDTDETGATNQIALAFGLNLRGSFALEDGSNMINVSNIFRNALRFHDLIFGSRATHIQNEHFAEFLPSYDSIFDFIEWTDILCDEGQCGMILYEARMQASKERMSPEEFFRMYPSTGCPYIHCWNDEKDDIESTCTLCEGRERSRSPRCSPTQAFSCVECGTFLGLHNPRQYCGKTHCLEF